MGNHIPNIERRDSVSIVLFSSDWSISANIEEKEIQNDTRVEVSEVTVSTKCAFQRSDNIPSIYGFQESDHNKPTKDWTIRMKSKIKIK